jgi:ATP/maltotriose-dependent transcriptional regulator MalT
MRHVTWITAVGGALVALVIALGCVGSTDDSGGGKGSGRVTQLPEPDDAISEPLMLSLLQAKNFHHQAKVYMADAKLAEATDAVRKILALDFPAGASEGEDVRLDARAMLAKLQIAQGDIDGAMKTVDEGIASASRESFFLANLHTVRGEVLEARVATLDAEQKTDEAKATRKAAIEAYTESNRIAETLQKRLVEEMKR